jgi:CDP-glucose 4,6-dehydratase
MIAAKQYEDKKYAGYYNIGPNDYDCVKTGDLVDTFVNIWGDGLKWVSKDEESQHEANVLKLDCSKIKATFGWTPSWNLEKAIEKTIEWSKHWIYGRSTRACMDRQIDEFLLLKK